MIDIVYYKINSQLDDETYNILLKILPKRLQVSVEKFVQWKDRHRSLFGKLLLRLLLIKYDFSEKILEDLKITTYGRYFIDESIDFNISHSEDIVICAISRSLRIGIDVEYINDTINVSDFTSVMQEKEYLDVLNSNIPSNSFYQLWTKKEAIIKADGRGLSYNVLDIDLLDGYARTKDNIIWYLEELNIEENYFSHIASSLKVDTINLNQVTHLGLFLKNRTVS